MNSRVPTLGGGGGGVSLPDPEALLVALVLVPASYPRNRFFELFRAPEARRARRRAANLRTILDELQRGAIAVRVTPWGAGFEVGYALPELAAHRRVRLERLEVTLLAAVLRRAGAGEALVGPLVERVGETAVVELAPVLARLLEA
ncbi:MAG: hypothetical protein FJ096_06730 [Deltaproteobacteria bacterium]|nr:hypothetical protein [Deltaproteobacteria bacterium]